MGSARVVFAGSVLWRFRFCYYFRFRVAFACSLCRVSEGPSAEAAGAAGAPAYIYIGGCDTPRRGGCLAAHAARARSAQWAGRGAQLHARPHNWTIAQLRAARTRRRTFMQAALAGPETGRVPVRVCVCARGGFGPPAGPSMAPPLPRPLAAVGCGGRPRQERGRERGREGRRLRAHSGARQRPRCPLIFSLCSTRAGRGHAGVCGCGAGLRVEHCGLALPATGRPALFCVATPTALLEQYCGAPAHWGGVQEWCPRI